MLDYLPVEGILVLDSSSLRSWEYQRGQFDLALMPGQSEDFAVRVLSEHLESFEAWVDEMSRLLGHAGDSPLPVEGDDALAVYVEALEELYGSMEASVGSGSWDLDGIRSLVERVNRSAPQAATSVRMEVR